jgi:hypothetical protein
VQSFWIIAGDSDQCGGGLRPDAKLPPKMWRKLACQLFQCSINLFQFRRQHQPAFRQQP